MCPTHAFGISSDFGENAAAAIKLFGIISLTLMFAA